MRIYIHSNYCRGFPGIRDIKVELDGQTIVSRTMDKNELLNLSKQLASLSEDINKISQFY
jgi:hypothetical protein